MTILNKYKRWKPILLIDKSRFYDFVLSLDNSQTVKLDGSLTNKCLISYIDTNNPECLLEQGGLLSMSGYSYENCINGGYELSDIGLTATDNGHILFEKSGITEEEYLSIIQESKAFIQKDNCKLMLIPVSGNTHNYVYDCSPSQDLSGNTFYSFNGGFLQGIYKGYGFDYQILPQYIPNAFSFEFEIRPRSDYKNSGNTLNSTYEKNKGIFFYIGTRAENKFIQFYNYDLSAFNLRSNGHTENTIETNVSAITSGNTTTSGSTSMSEATITSGDTITYGGAEEIKTLDLKTSEGHTILEKNENDILTDNGYLIYNRTKGGYTTKTWNKEDKLKIINDAKIYKENLYLLLNRTPSGYTTKTLENYSGETLNDPNEFIADIVDNAFALKITDDGRIGYKYLVLDCDKELHYSIKEEYSFPNIITKDKWNTVSVILKIINGGLDKCEKPIGKRKMKIYIYVGGYLKFVSQELPELRIRELNETYEKQEFVPFNISLGGGTQGLCESTWLNSYDGFPYILPIEENFAGTFIGDIKSFKFYNCLLQLNELKNNSIFLEREQKI